jgi:hypothetical protein
MGQDLNKNIKEATILTGYAKGETVFIPRMPLIQVLFKDILIGL